MFTDDSDADFDLKHPYQDKTDMPDTLTRKDKADIPFSPLLAEIFTQMATDAASTTNRLVESLEYENARLRAELDIIRKEFSKLVNGDYQPTLAALERTLYPSPYLIELEVKRNSDMED